MTNEEKVKKIVKRYTASKQRQAPHRDQWDKNIKLYEGILDNLQSLKDANMSHLFIMQTFMLTEWIMETLILEVGTVHPIVKMIPVGDTPEIVAYRNETLFDYQLQQNKIQLSIEKAIRQQVGLGNGVFASYWNPTSTSALGLIVEWIDIYNFFPDSKADCFDNAEWAIRRKEVSLEYLESESKKGYYKNISWLKKYLENANVYPLKYPAIIGKGTRKLPNGEYMVELLEHWSKFENTWITVAAEKYVIKEEAVPFKEGTLPFSYLGCYKRITPQMYDKSDIEVLEDYQHELNTMRNLRRDQERLIVKKLLKVAKGEHLTEKALRRWLTGGILEVTNPDKAIVEQKLTPLSPDAYLAPAEIKQEMQGLVGADDYARGSTPQRQELATNLILLQKASMRRMSYKLRNIGLALCNLAQQVVWNNINFIKQPLTRAILGNEELTDPTTNTMQNVYADGVSGKELVGNFDFRSQLHSATINESVKKQEALLLYGNLLKDPYVNPKKRLEHLLLAYGQDPQNWYTQMPNVLGGGGGMGMGPGMEQGFPQGEAGAGNPEGADIARNMRNLTNSGSK